MIEYTGLRETIQSLEVVDNEFFQTVMTGLMKVGEVVRVQAASDFAEYGSDGSRKREASFVRSAEGFDTRVRPHTSTAAIVGIGQRLRKSPDIPRRRPNFGDLQMRHGLLKARGEKLDEAYEILEVEVAERLHASGL